MRINRNFMHQLTNNATFAGVFSGIICGLLGLFSGYFAHDVTMHDAVTYNNITSYIESELVEPGYISKEVLEKENPFDQIRYIGEEIHKKLSSSENNNEVLIEGIKTFLIDCGKSEDTVRKMDVDSLIKALEEESAKIETIKSDLENAQEKISEYEKLTTAELKTPVAIISGEQYSNPVHNYLALINGHNYYSEEFLNSFLEYELASDDNTVYYHRGAPERVKVTENMYYDQAGDIYVHTGDKIYTMEREEYIDGLILEGVSAYDDTGEIKLASKKDYSAIEFKVGHIDNESTGDKDIIIYYLDEEDNYVATDKKIHCTGDMSVQTYTIPIYNTKTIKITSQGRGDYLITDVYLIR